jgi:uncharacterized protein
VPPANPSLWVLGGIGVVSGFMSALLGVGGGLVIVPLVVLLAGFDSRVATATSLGAILLTALAGVTSFSLFDHVHWGGAAAVGLPAVAGAVVGVRLQAMITSRTLTLLFAIFVTVIAVVLLVIE